LLTDYISRCRIAFHFDACKELASDAVEEAKKAAEEKEVARLEAVRGLVEREQEAGLRRGLVGNLEVDEGMYEYEEEEEEEELTQEQLDAIEEGEENEDEEGEGMDFEADEEGGHYEDEGIRRR
jgi:hypothetical protein